MLAVALSVAAGCLSSSYKIDAERIGTCSWSWREPLSNVVSQMDDSGIKGIQLALGPFILPDERHGGAEDLKMFEQIKLKAEKGEIVIMSTMVGTVGEDYTTLETIKNTGGIVPDQHWEANKKIVSQGAKLTAQLGCKYMSTHAGFLDESDPKAFKKYVERVSWMRDECRKYGVELILESGQETAEDLAIFMAKVPGVGINFDPANMILYAKGEPMKAVEILYPWIKQVHIKDALVTKVPGTWGTEVPWGEGEVGGLEFIAKLEKLGYKGNYVVEREAGDSRAKDIKLAVERIVK